MKSLGCMKCDWTADLRTFEKRCPVCGSPVDCNYDLEKAQIYNDPNPLIRYFDLLPLIDHSTIKWCGEGNTPTVHARNFGKIVGLNQLWLKDETANPTKSTKDRPFSLVLSFFEQCGIKEFVICSTGNSSTSCARAATLYNDFKVHIFCGNDFFHRLNFEDQPNIQVYKVNSDFVTAGKVAKQFAETNGLLWEGGFFNLARRAGHKLAYLEAIDDMQVQPDIIIQAISSGMGLMGAYQGVQEYLQMGRIQRLPRIVAAQQESCSPMVNAWEAGYKEFDEKFVIQNPHGIAEAILRSNPKETYGYIRNIIETTQGQFVKVNEEEILEIKQLLYETEGIVACNASAVALGAAVKMRREGNIGIDTRVLVNLSGGVRSDEIVPTNLRLLEVI